MAAEAVPALPAGVHGPVEGLTREQDVAAEGRVVIFSDRSVVAAGLAGMLPGSPSHPESVPTMDGLVPALDPSPAAVIVDGAAACAAQAAELARERGVPLVLLIDRLDERRGDEALQAADAVMLREEIETTSLALALCAATRGMRLLPKEIDAAAVPRPARSVPAPANDRMLEALALVADGCRDAEIGLRLNVSESAARKLVQRAVRRMGARTRSEAVAKAIAADCLE